MTYGGEILQKVDVGINTDKDASDLLMYSDNLTQYIDYSRNLPDSINDQTLAIYNFVTEDLYVFVKRLDDSLREKYIDKVVKDESTLESDLDKIRKLTIYLDEMDRTVEANKIDKNMLKDIKEMKKIIK